MSRTAESPTRRRWFGRRAERRDLTRESLPSVMLPDASSPSAPGVRSAHQIADCYACLRALADGAALVPLRVYRKTGKTAQLVEDGDTVALLERPSPSVPTPAFVGQTVAMLAAHGEALVGLYRGGPDNSITQLGLLDPTRTQIRTVLGEPVFTYTHPDGTVDDNLTVDDVCWIRGGLVDEFGRGISPIRACRDALALAKSLATTAATLHDNEARPGGILTVGAGGEAGEDDQAEALAAAWEQRHKGPKKRGRIAVLTGEVSYTQVQLSAADAQWVETRQLSTAEVARIFRVLPWVIGAASGDSLTYSNTSEQLAAFAKFSLSPLLTYVEAALSTNTELFPPGHFCRFDLSELTRGDSAERAERNTKALHPQTGWLTKNEVREAEGFSPEEEP